MNPTDLAFGAIPLRLYERATRTGRLRRAWGPLIALATLVCASAGSYKLGVWDGRNSEALSLDHAVVITKDSMMSDANIVSAAYRLHIIARTSIEALVEARKRNAFVRDQVDVWLDKLSSKVRKENRN